MIAYRVEQHCQPITRTPMKRLWRMKKFFVYKHTTHPQQSLVLVLQMAIMAGILDTSATLQIYLRFSVLEISGTSMSSGWEIFYGSGWSSFVYTGWTSAALSFNVFVADRNKINQISTRQASRWCSKYDRSKIEQHSFLLQILLRNRTTKLAGSFLLPILRGLWLWKREGIE